MSDNTARHNIKAVDFSSRFIFPPKFKFIRKHSNVVLTHSFMPQLHGSKEKLESHSSEDLLGDRSLEDRLIRTLQNLEDMQKTLKSDVFSRKFQNMENELNQLNNVSLDNGEPVNGCRATAEVLSELNLVHSTLHLCQAELETLKLHVKDLIQATHSGWKEHVAKEVERQLQLEHNQVPISRQFLIQCSMSTVTRKLWNGGCRLKSCT